MIVPLSKIDHPIEENPKFVMDFYEQYKSYMFYAARKFTTDQQECEDIVHDAVLRLLKHTSTLHSLDHNKTITYLSLTIRSVYLDRTKSGMKKEHPVPNTSLELLHAKQDPDTDEEFDYEAKWDAQILKGALSEKDWNLLESKYVIGCTDDEIAQAMQYSPDSVRTLLRRAKKRAKKILSGKE